MKLVHHNTGGNGESSHQIYFEDVINRHNLSGITGYGSTKEESMKDFEKKLEWLSNEIESILTLFRSGQCDVVEKGGNEKPEPPIYRKPDILPLKKFYITRENFDELRSVYIENTIRCLKSSNVYRAYARYVGAWKLLMFPVPLYAVIEMAILEHLDKVNDTCVTPIYIANDIITRLVRNEIPYLRLMQESEERLLYNGIMNMEKRVDTEYYKVISPLIKERLVMSSDKIIQKAKNVYGQDILDSKFKTEEIKFWSIYENLIKKQAEREA